MKQMPQDAQALLASDLPDCELILERLGRVLDPELDESMLQLGFIESLHVQDRHETVQVQKPTAWCAANFAYMMAEDVRRELLAVNRIHDVTINMGSHFTSEQIEQNVNAGAVFADAFASEGGGDLNVLRETFLRKGFTTRQERLLRNMKQAGLTASEICALLIMDLECVGETCRVRVGDGRTVEVGSAEIARRYLERRAEMNLNCAPLHPLFTDLDDLPITSEQLETYFIKVRTTRLSMEANGSFCRALLATRRAQSPDIPMFA